MPQYCVHETKGGLYASESLQGKHVKNPEKLFAQLSEILLYWRTGKIRCYHLYGTSGYLFNFIDVYQWVTACVCSSAQSPSGKTCAEKPIIMDTVRRMQCLHYLGTITGQITNEDQLDFIFSKFRIGK